MKFIDQLHRDLYLDTHPKRIVSLVPSQTELLVGLGLEDAIVGITKFCVHPAHLKTSKAIVGGTKKINYRRITALKPDIIICNKEENTKEIVEELAKKYSVYVSDIVTLEDAFSLFLDMGKIFDKKAAAQQLVKDIQVKLNNFTKFIEQSPLKRVAYFIWAKPWMAAGGNNYINTILKLNKFDNIFKNSPDRYLEVYIEYLTGLSPELQPEIIMLPSEPFTFEEKHVEELKKYINCQFMFVDGEMFSWYGSRLLTALDYFKELQNKMIE